MSLSSVIYLKIVHDQPMKTIMKLEELETIDHLDQFLNGTQAVIFETVAVKKERYGWIQHELVRFNYLPDYPQSSATSWR